MRSCSTTRRSGNSPRTSCDIPRSSSRPSTIYSCTRYATTFTISPPRSPSSTTRVIVSSVTRLPVNKLTNKVTQNHILKTFKFKNFFFFFLKEQSSQWTWVDWCFVMPPLTCSLLVSSFSAFKLSRRCRLLNSPLKVSQISFVFFFSYWIWFLVSIWFINDFYYIYKIKRNRLIYIIYRI